MASDKRLIMSGLVWKFTERMASQGVSFVVSVVLARLLMPEQYGVIAMINIFMVFANLFVDGGFTSALVQKKDADEIDFSTVFYCCLSISFIMYGLMYVAAPYISIFYNMPELTPITRVYALSLIISTYNSIQNAYISRNMLFKKTFGASFISLLCSGGVGICMAFAGCGVWSLIGQYLSNIIISTFVLRIIVKWQPIIAFSVTRARQMMSYGSKLLVANFVNAIVQEIRQLIIGKCYTSADLAYYNRGNHLPSIVRSNLDSTLMNVLFPAMSNHSDSPQRVKELTRNAIRLSSYLTFFGLTVMAVASEPIVRLLLTDKWIECVPYMQIICISHALGSISVANMSAMKALGKSDELLKLEAFKKPIFLLLVLLSARISVLAIALTMPLYSIYAACMNMKPTKELLDYGHKEQLKDLLPAFVLNLAVVLFAYPITFLQLNDWLTLLLQVIVATGIYIALSKLFNVFAYGYLLNTARAGITKIRNK